MRKPVFPNTVVLFAATSARAARAQAARVAARKAARNAARGPSPDAACPGPAAAL